MHMGNENCIYNDLQVLLSRLLPEGHIVKVLADFLPVGVDETLGIHAGGSLVTGSLAGSRAGTVGRPAGLVTASMRSRRSGRKKWKD